MAAEDAHQGEAGGGDLKPDKEASVCGDLKQDSASGIREGCGPKDAACRDKAMPDGCVAADVCVGNPVAPVDDGVAAAVLAG